ncbi:unnamed protein product, partial [Polarella glacialis]
DKLPLLCAIARKFDLDEPVVSEPFTSSSSLPVAKPEAALAAKVSPLLLAVAQACPANLTGADVSVLCADAYGVAQREYIALLHDVADRLKCSISTLLLFLDQLELKLSGAGEVGAAANGSRRIDLLGLTATAGGDSSAFVPVFPPKTAKAKGGLVLYGSHGTPGACVLAHHTGGSSAEGLRDVCAAVAFEALEQPQPQQLLESWQAFCQGSSLGRESATRSSLGAATSCTVVQGLDLSKPLRVRVGRRHFQEALNGLQPSVPPEDLQRYEVLRAEYSNTKGI